MSYRSENTTQFALLGLLYGAPMTGYAIKRSFDQGVNNFWNVSYGQIYPGLKRLVGRKYATVKEERTPGRPARKVYRITAKGRQALRMWLAKPPTIRPTRSEVALKLCFGAFGRTEDQISHLTGLAVSQERRLSTFRSVEKTFELKGAARDQVFQYLTLRMGIVLTEALARWARDSVRTLEKLKETPGGIKVKPAPKPRCARPPRNSGRYRARGRRGISDE